MAIEYVIGAAFVGGCLYMSYRGRKRVDAANERMKQFSEEVERLGNKADIFALSEKYGLVTIPASFNSSGPRRTEKIKFNPQSGLEERSISNGNSWMSQK